MGRYKKSDDPRVQAIQVCRKIIAHALVISEVIDSLEDPQIPEVLVNPHFLVVPKLGSLVTIDIQSLPEDGKLWDFTLAKIEDLFEIKMSAGAQTVASLILFEWERSESNHDAIKLLGQMFDQILVISLGDDMERKVTKFVRELVGSPAARESLNYLWKLEGNARQSNFEQITNLSYVRDVLNAHLEFEKRPPRPRVSSTYRELFFEREISSPMEDLIFEKLLVEPPFWIQDHPRVMNMKQYLLNSLTQYHFTFDFVFSPNQLFNGYIDYFGPHELDRLFETGGGICKVIKGSKGAFGRIATLRKLATYARFISYIPDEQIHELQLKLRTIPPRLFLLIDGNIFGPSYAPDRYLNMLIHAGWCPINIDNFSKDALMEGVHNGQ